MLKNVCSFIGETLQINYLNGNVNNDSDNNNTIIGCSLTFPFFFLNTSCS